jgi:hypothetical protein
MMPLKPKMPKQGPVRKFMCFSQVNSSKPLEFSLLLLDTIVTELSYGKMSLVTPFQVINLASN